MSWRVPLKTIETLRLRRSHQPTNNLNHYKPTSYNIISRVYQALHCLQ